MGQKIQECADVIYGRRHFFFIIIIFFLQLHKPALVFFVISNVIRFRFNQIPFEAFNERSTFNKKAFTYDVIFLDR